ncbi:hypothetical protein [Mucilaginibacter sp. 10I4]|uniref:hypothetical protein n=1 Tax=Mucilaginibacter sp. 10I4 TaxID=3048580 RepID=UPI002B223209|nr:hypothetical protein [Mucilaginibacter sp. 10I4]
MKIKEKQYLIYEKKRDNQAIIHLSGEGGIRTLFKVDYQRYNLTFCHHSTNHAMGEINLIVKD